MALLVGELKAALGLDTSKYDQGLDRSHSKFGKFVKSAALLSAAGAAAAAAGLLGLAKGAAEDEKAQAVLAKTLKNTAGATDAQVASIETYITKVGAATGVTDDQMRPALANLVRATHDVGKAQGLMGLAMDVSAGTGKDLGAVSMALAKAQNGNVGALGKLGIATKDASGKTKSFEQIQKDLAKTFTGQAAASAETTSGKYARLRLIMAEAGETIGAKVLPVLLALGTFLLDKVVPAVFEFGTRVQIKLLPPLRQLGEFVKAEVIPRVKELGGFITGTLIPGLVSLGKFIVKNKDFFVPFAATIVVILAAVKAWTIAQAALNIVLAANPIGLVVIAIAALVAGLVWAYRNSDRFRAIVDGAFRAVAKVVTTVIPAVIDFFRDNWKRLPLLLLGPIGIVLFLFKGLPGKILGAVGNVAGTLAGKGKDFVTGLAKGVYNNVTGFVRWWAQLPGNVIRWIGDTSKTLGKRGLGFITGLAQGVYNNLTGLARFWAQLPSTVIRWIGATERTLFSKGAGFLQGLWAGLINKWRSVTHWVSGLKASVSAWLGDTSRFLVGKGGDVLGGFWTGLKNKWGEVTKWVSGIATWIKDHKGPISLDGRLLIPAGEAIMSGFLTGLKSGAGKAWDFVQSVGGKSKAALASALGVFTEGGLTGAGLSKPPTSLSDIATVVRTVAAQRGWGTGPQWDALYSLIMGESGFRNTAQNPTSSAYGIFQFLNSTWATVGGHKTSDPWLQTTYGLRYIANAYGSPLAAYSAWRGRSPHWYKDGGWLMPGELAYNETRRPEAILNRGQWNALAAGGGGGRQVVLEVRPGGSALDRLFISWLQNAVRGLGGVDVVFGRR